MFIMINVIMMIMMILLSVAFTTLLERKILGIMQLRKGPNKASIKGIFQPISDAIKLLSKEWIYLNLNMTLFTLSPMMMFVMSMLLWMIYPWSKLMVVNNSIMVMIFILSIGIYPILFIGWSSNNMFSMIGTIRAISQMLSFEISLFLMLFTFMIMIESFDFQDLFKFQIKTKFIFMMFPLYILFLISMLIELNRTPFDLIEGESELVSGFNIEYSGSMFTLIFLSEYSSILAASVIMTLLFFGFPPWSVMFILLTLIHIIMFIWIRGLLPRIRYDQLMMMCWTEFLPVVLLYSMFTFIMKEVISIINF